MLRYTISPRLKNLFGKTLKQLQPTEQHAGSNGIDATYGNEININFIKKIEVEQLIEATQCFIELGFFQDNNNLEKKYFMALNRYYSTENDLRFTFKDLNNHTNWTVTSFVDTINTTIITDVNDEAIFINMIVPGDAKLYSIVPTIIAGGELLADETVEGNYTLETDLIIGQNVTLTINGTYDVYGNITLKNNSQLLTTGNGKINFHNGTKLLVDGAVTIQGTPSNKLTLDFIARNDITQNGVILLDESSFNGEYLIIKNGCYGISKKNNITVNGFELRNSEINNCNIGVQIVGAEDFSPYITNVTVTNSSFAAIYMVGVNDLTIKSCNLNGFYGIWSYNNSYPRILNNTISPSHQDIGSGIYSHSGSGDFRRNTITGFRTGIFLAHSSPQLAENIITGNSSHGIYVGTGSAPNMRANYVNQNGIVHLYPLSGYNVIYENNKNAVDGSEIYVKDSSPLLNYGYNIIKDDREPTSLMDTQLLINGNITIPLPHLKARLNYWGNSPYFNGNDPVNRFGIEADYLPYLTEPPQYAPIAQYKLIRDEEARIVDTVYAIEELSDPLDPLYNLMAIAEENFLSKDYQLAYDLYEDIITNFGDDPYTYTAYERLYIIERLTETTYQEFQDLQGVYTVQKDLTEDEFLSTMLEQLVSLIYVDIGEYLSAIERFQDIINENPDSEEAVFAEIDAIITAYISGSSGELGKYSNEYLMNESEMFNRIEKLLHKKYGMGQRVEEEVVIPLTYQLYQNYPNPFNPVTIIRYEIPERSKVELRVYDILGKEVMTIVNEYKDAGRYEASFNASKLSSGVYIYTIKAGEFISSKKMMLLK